MTVQAQTSTQYYSGPISAGTTLAITDFTFIDNSHVSVKIRNVDTIWTYGVDYTVEGAGKTIRNLTIKKDVKEGEVLAIYLDVPITQTVHPEEGGKFPATTNEFTLDKLTYICQMLQERIARSLQISIDTPFDGVLSKLIPNRTFKINADATGIELSEYDPDIALDITKQYRDESQVASQAAKASETNAKASEQAAKTSETNAKASEIAVDQIKQETDQLKNDTQAIADKALQDISTAKTDAVDTINSEETSTIQAINSEETSAIQAINSEEASAISNIQTEGGKYVQEAKDWAIKMNGKVNNEDYSSKYYADQVKILTAGSLNQKQITNCILEAPQRIKWEVIDGVFYIKAGSILTRPNGWVDKEQRIRKFEYKTLDTNIALSQITNKNTVNVILFFVGAKQSGNEGLWYFDNEVNVFSQDTPPAVSIATNMWYDTDNNIIKYTTDSGKNWIDEEIYFPAGIVSLANSKFDSVVDIFNGSGFIGSCGWVDRGVKVLFSNGRNNDGTLKNVEASTTEISIGNPLAYRNAVSHMLLTLNQDNSVVLNWLLHVYEGDVLPSIVPSDNEYFYHKTENIWYYHKINETKWQKATEIPIILRRCWFGENTRIQSSSVNTPISLAKEQDIDGKYTTSTMYLMQNATLTKDYNKTFDLSSYLPNDNHPYMVLVDAILRTGSAVNNSFGLYVKSNLMSNVGCLCRAVTRTDKVNAIAGCTSFIPVGSDHTISLLAGNESNASTFANSTSISLNGFRRIR